MDDVIGQRPYARLDAGRQCTATSKSTGRRCGRAPIVGGFVCDHHGGKVPAVRASARERLLAMVDPAMDALLRALKTGPPCGACGRTDADRDPVVVRAAQIVLDRAGLGPSASLAVTAAEPAAPWVEWLTPEQRQVMSEHIWDAKRRMRAGEPKPPACVSRVVDGAAIEGDGELQLEAALVQGEVERPVIREIVTRVIDPPAWD